MSSLREYDLHGRGMGVDDATSEFERLVSRARSGGVRVFGVVTGYGSSGGTCRIKSAVRREAREESSIELKDIRYVMSQTWPFPSNIMIGFRAEHAGGVLRPDGDEVLESRWFRRENLPEIPRKGSIARQMIDAWNEWSKLIDQDRRI